MEKVYRLLQWLDMTQAVDYLEHLTKTPFTESLLLQLCDVGECSVYMDCMGVHGESAFDVGEDQPAYEPAIGRGYCKVAYPSSLRRSGFASTVIGPALFLFDDTISDDREWIIRSIPERLSPIFKAADIEVLATKMNGADDLRQQLEQERAAREAAEAEAADLRRQLDNAKTAYEALRRENRALHNGWDAAQAESTRKGYELADATAELEHLRQQAPTEARPEHPTEAATGLTFPYVTKELEAACAAAMKYWCDFDPERPPLQKQISGFMVDRGVPARQATELAIAIKPDDQKKA